MPHYCGTCRNATLLWDLSKCHITVGPVEMSHITVGPVEMPHYCGTCRNATLLWDLSKSNREFSHQNVGLKQVQNGQMKVTIKSYPSLSVTLQHLGPI